MASSVSGVLMLRVARNSAPAARAGPDRSAKSLCRLSKSRGRLITSGNVHPGVRAMAPSANRLLSTAPARNARIGPLQTLTVDAFASDHDAKRPYYYAPIIHGAAV